MNDEKLLIQYYFYNPFQLIVLSRFNLIFKIYIQQMNQIYIYQFYKFYQLKISEKRIIS